MHFFQHLFLIAALSLRDTRSAPAYAQRAYGRPHMALAQCFRGVFATQIAASRRVPKAAAAQKKARTSRHGLTSGQRPVQNYSSISRFTGLMSSDGILYDALFSACSISTHETLTLLLRIDALEAAMLL